MKILTADVPGYKNASLLRCYSPCWKACTEAGKVVKMPARLSLHDLRRTGNHILESHRCPNHPAGIEELVRERLMEHVPETCVPLIRV